MSVPYEEMEEETEEMHPLLKYLEMGNIASEIEGDDAANDILRLYNEAKESMGPWLKKYKRAINLAKLQAMSGDTEITSKGFPFEGASIAMMPYILEAMLDFNSRAAPDLAWADELVHPKIYGENSKQKEDRAKRVADYSNYQLKELMPDWQMQQDKGLLALPCVGTIYKETYIDPDTKEICSDLLLADEVIFDHNYPTFKQAPDKFTIAKYSRNEVLSFIRGEQQWLIDEKDLNEDLNEFEFIKACTWIDVDDDGIKEPYLAYLWEEKTKIVALYPYFDDDTLTANDKGEVIKIEAIEKFTPYYFLPDPSGGPMGLGWGILLGPMFDAINTNVRQLIDAGTLSNTSANSGLISEALATGRGNSMSSAPIEIIQGQLTPVPNHGAGSLRDNILQLPFSGPNVVLFQLMEYLVNSARSMTNAAINVEANAGEAASLYLARLQQGLKVPNSIIMRVYSCAKREFQKIAELNHRYADNKKYNRVLDTEIEADMKFDFNPEDCDIRLVADPSQGSDIERIQRSTAILEMATTQTQQVINYREAMLRVLREMKTTDLETLAPEPDPNAVDPMQQLMMAQQAAEMELRKQDQMLRADEITIKRQKVALDAAKEMAALGLQSDKQEAEIQALYIQSLERLYKSGVDSTEEATRIIQKIEAQFIGDRREIPTNNPGPNGNMVEQRGNQDVPSMPPMVQ